MDLYDKNKLKLTLKSGVTISTFSVASGSALKAKTAQAAVESLLVYLTGEYIVNPVLTAAAEYTGAAGPGNQPGAATPAYNETIVNQMLSSLKRLDEARQKQLEAETDGDILYTTKQHIDALTDAMNELHTHREAANKARKELLKQKEEVDQIIETYANDEREAQDQRDQVQRFKEMEEHDLRVQAGSSTETEEGSTMQEAGNMAADSSAQPGHEPEATDVVEPTRTSASNERPATEDLDADFEREADEDAEDLDEDEYAEEQKTEVEEGSARRKRNNTEEDIEEIAADNTETEDGENEGARADANGNINEDGLIHGPPPEEKSGEYDSGDLIIDDRGIEYKRTSKGWQETGARYGAITKEQKEEWDRQLGEETGSLKESEPGTDSASSIPPAGQQNRGGVLDQYSGQRTDERGTHATTAISIMQQQSDVSAASRAGDSRLREAKRTADAGGQEAQITRDAAARETARGQREQSMGTILGDAVTEGVQRGVQVFGSSVGAAAATRAAGELFGPPRHDTPPSDADTGPTDTTAATSPSDADTNNQPPEAAGATAVSAASVPESSTQANDEQWTSVDDQPVTITWPCGHEWTGLGKNAPSWCTVPGCSGTPPGGY